MEKAYPDPDYRREVLVAWDQSIGLTVHRAGKISPREYRVVSKSGKVLYVEIAGITLADEMIVTFNDATARHIAEAENDRLHRLYAMLSQTNKLITRTKSRSELMEGVCRISVEEGRFLFAWFAVPDADGNVIPVARHGADRGYIDSVKATIDPSDPRGRGPTGQVFRSGKTVVNNKFLTSKETEPWHEFAKQVGLGASSVFAVYHQGAVYGTLNLYAAENDFFGREEVQTLEEMASDISYALDNITRDEERALAVNEVETLSRRLTHYLAVSPVISYMLSVDGERPYPEWVSENVEHLLGFRVDEVLDREWWSNHLHHDDRTRAIEAVRGVFSKGELRHEYRFHRKDGSVLWVLDTMLVMRNELGGPLRIFGAWTDITERKTNDESIRLQSAALNAAANAILITDVNGSIEWVNPAFSRLTQYSLEEARGKNPRQLIRSGKQDRAFYKEMWDTILSGQVWRGILVNRRKDGSLYKEVQSINPILNGAGAVTHFVAIKEDVTERERTESALRDSQERLRRALAIGRIALWEWDTGNGSVHYSPEWASLLGTDSFGDSGSLDEWFDRVHPDDLMLLRRVLSEVKTTRKLDVQREFRLRHASGEFRWIMMNASLVRDEPDSPGRVVGSNVDVSERKRLQHEFEQAQKLESIGRLAGGVAHDFNNLLSVITGYSEIVLADLPAGSEAYNDLLQVKLASDRAANLTRQLLAFSRRQVLSPEVLKINGIIIEAEKMFRRLIGEDIVLRLNLAADLGEAMADPGQIDQVLMNLVVNARDAMPTGGVLLIATHNEFFSEPVDFARFVLEPGAYVHIAVSDTGIGMTDEVLERLFEPFFTTKEAGKGTGLGLATVYGIVKQSGGHITVKSSLGVGTTFEIYFPRIDARELPVQGIESIHELVGNETILLVEDEDALRVMTQRILERAGYRVFSASNGRDALSILEREGSKIQLLLTDVVMPSISGAELAAQSIVLQPSLKVVYISGYTDDALSHHGVLEPGINLIMKPYTSAKLTTEIRRVLDYPVN